MNRNERGNQALNILKNYFTEEFVRNNSEMQRMNRVTNHYKKCVMTLENPAWFVQLWVKMSFEHMKLFQSHIEEILGLSQKDFYVDVQTNKECPVIFYVKSTLEPLILRTFHTHEFIVASRTIAETPLYQALHVLHNPSLGQNEYRSFINEAYDAPENRGNPLLMMPLTTTTNLSALSTLLAQLRSDEVTPVAPPFYIWKLKAIRQKGDKLYDRYNGFVVVAQTEAAARAQCKYGDEGWDDNNYWDNPKRSSCEKIGLSYKQSDSVVLFDHYAA
jgi:hypothetical protein